MDTIIVTKLNDVYLHVDCSDGMAYELSDFFKFRVPNFQFIPAFKMKMWDGYIRLFNRYNKTLYIGLLSYLVEFADKRGYEVVIEPLLDEQEDVSLSVSDAHYTSLLLPAGITPRDYQLYATQQAIQKKRCLLVSPTGSGKSLIIYSIIRWYNKKTLVIVPTKSLVSQMKGDFNDYSRKDPTFDAEASCHQIMEGMTKDTNKPIVISTWQSIYKMPEKWFNQFDVVIGDEVHLFKAKSLTGIMEKCTEVPVRMGTTGTLDDSKTHRLVLEGLFGSKVQVTKTKTLMEKKQLSTLKAKCIVLKYDDEESKALVKKKGYQDEIKFITNHSKRNNFITNLAIKQQKNTLILFQLKKHGKELFSIIEKKLQKMDSDRNVFYVAGETATSEREEIRAIAEREKGCIIVASFGVYSTGVNIKNLYNIIFAAPYKAKIKILQSIGRGLRVGKESLVVYLYDIADDLSWKSKKNYTLKHLLERIKLYTKEKFEYTIHKVNLPPDK